MSLPHGIMALVPGDFSGVLIIDKPPGMTSHDVVAKVRRLLSIRQVGHFGTLDPFATGVLPLSVGKATRFAQFYLKSRKAYEGAIRFGYSTDTYDATGKPSSDLVAPQLDATTLNRIFREFTGRVLQTPPAFSAKRVGGKRAYQLARKQKPFQLSPVEVEIYALELIRIDGDRVWFAVECSGGTYVRSLAHDMGQRVGCGGHLAELRRTAVAEFGENRAVTLEKLEQAVGEGTVESCRVPLEALLPDCPEFGCSRARREERASRTHVRVGPGTAPRASRRLRAPERSEPAENP